MRKTTHTIDKLQTPALGVTQNCKHGAMALHAKGAVLIILLAILILAPLSIANAQETETPTPTATPVPMYQISLPSGSLMQIDRSVSYGDIYVTASIILLTMVIVVFNVLRIIDNVRSDK